MGQIFLIDKSHEFPDPRRYPTSVDYPFCIGGDLDPDRLELAYDMGLFPWFSEGEEIAWWCPDPRFVLRPEKIKVSKSMRSLIRSKCYRISENEHFEQVISSCQEIKRKNQPEGSWITSAMKSSYMELHRRGRAKSIEVWEEDTLIGGLYGIQTGNVFCGESMFSRRSNASKMALIELAQNGKYELIDCQVYTEHLERMGAEFMPKEKFLDILQRK